MTEREVEMVTSEQHHITITFPASYSWDDIRKDLKDRVDIYHSLWEREHAHPVQRERIERRQALGLTTGQEYMLTSLRQYGRWHPDTSHWQWNNRSGTIRIFDALVKKRLAVLDDDGETYRPTTNEDSQLD